MKSRRPEIRTKPRVPGKKPVAKGKLKRKKNSETWVAVGIDVSMSSVAAAAFAYDGITQRIVGPATAIIRWERGTDYYDRLKAASRAENVLHELFNELALTPELDQTYIAVEEPWPFGMHKRMESNALKQQAQISGAVLSGLVRWGWTQVFEINNTYWRKIVAEALGITIHHSKWNPTKKEGKFRAREYCQQVYPDMPGFPDLIQHSKRGLIPRPEGSKAQAVQNDDRYTAVAIADWMRGELKKGM